ncbi:hypothetical protein DPMN_105257 [Dreissena polymorpha]|uniref:Uncharacterized protein n=1 Tax=Dreissena polymorpha TaxID=45954 RepID=A0A9D4HBA1_DREPO|nr:hypothetical protein DPMN_105257 [Dreissena polymorpha]
MLSCSRRQPVWGGEDRALRNSLEIKRPVTAMSIALFDNISARNQSYRCAEVGIDFTTV